MELNEVAPIMIQDHKDKFIEAWLAYINLSDIPEQEIKDTLQVITTIPNEINVGIIMFFLGKGWDIEEFQEYNTEEVLNVIKEYYNV